ncbi:glycosyltransferase family 4 protein [Ilumatobacter nonamiensis]|uniref:glycosyltransferase family 4 protein n=1 Tax=Ilumatobacter nonamiensis TaxID=467093 RepID=UPI000348CC00|nr:glycosyltransferase family 4 protein [Ilumatobacter nonamiensis]
MTERGRRTRPRLVHLTTTDMSLDWLLGPQLRAFVDAGYEVIGMSAPGPHVAGLRADGIEHVPLSAFTRSNDLRSDVRGVRQLAAALRQTAPDILHTHNPKPGVLGRIVGRAVRVPLVVNTQHGLYAQPDDRRKRRWPVYAAEGFAGRLSHVELVQNEEDVATLVDTLHLPADRVRHLGNGIDLDRFDPATIDSGTRDELRREWGIGDDEVLALTVSRLVREKGIVELLEAARTLHARDVPLRLVVVGPIDVGKHDVLDETMVADAERDGVVFTGTRDDMPECYAAADLYVTASWREGMPRAAMEATAMGLPVVATDIRGNRQVVADGETGLLTPVRDSASLAEAIEMLTTDDAQRAKFASAARRRALTEFDQQRVIERTLDAYRLLDDGPSAVRRDPEEARSS